MIVHLLKQHNTFYSQRCGDVVLLRQNILCQLAAEALSGTRLTVDCEFSPTQKQLLIALPTCDYSEAIR